MATGVEVEGLPRIEQDATYRQVSLTPRGGTVETTFQIEKLDELREIKVRCTDYRTYAHWLITGAQDATFADLEIGFESNRAELGLLRLRDGTCGRGPRPHSTDCAPRSTIDPLAIAPTRPRTRRRPDPTTSGRSPLPLGRTSRTPLARYAAVARFRLARTPRRPEF